METLVRTFLGSLDSKTIKGSTNLIRGCKKTKSDQNIRIIKQKTKLWEHHLK
jgi:hypothetical protein